MAERDPIRDDVAGVAAPPLPRVAQVEPIGRCNLACRMCTVNDRPDGDHMLDLARFTALLDGMPGLEAVHLQGLGEPLMNPAFFDLVEAAVARGIDVSTNTNATLLTAARARRMVASGIASVSISLDGASAEVYESVRIGASFRKVLRNVSRLVGARAAAGTTRPELRLVMVLMRSNVAEVPALVELAADLGVEAVLVQRLASSLGEPTLPSRYAGVKRYVADAELRTHPTPEAPGADDLPMTLAAFDRARARAQGLGVQLHLPRLAPREGPPGCDWPSREIYLTASGEVLPCCMVATPDRASFGNALAAGVAATWHGEAARTFRLALASDTPPAVCRSCALYRGMF